MVLVALCLTHTHQRAKLAEALRARGSASAVAELEHWRPRDRIVTELARVLAVTKHTGLTAIPVWRWPDNLLRVRPLSPLLFVRGDPSLLWHDAIAIVGARQAHPSAERWAKDLAAAQARAGLLVVSGGARGVDAAAHRGAMEAGGRTIAYLGVASDCVYPRHNRRLFERILERGGALVSEFLPTERTFASGHAMRNRFIAAQALRLYVAEADVGSGSLTTATMARRMAVPILVSPAGIGVRRGGLDDLVARGAAEVAT